MSGQGGDDQDGVNVDKVRAEMGEPTSTVGRKKPRVDATMFRRTDVSGRPFSNQGFIRVVLVLGGVFVAGIFLLAKFGDVRSSVAAKATSSPTPVPLVASTPSSAPNPQDEADAAAEASRLHAAMGHDRSSYSSAFAQVNEAAKHIDANGNVIGDGSAPGGSGSGAGTNAAGAPAPGATVAPDGSNLGPAGQHIGGGTSGGIVTNDVPPGSSGGAVLIGQNGQPVVMPTTPAQGKLAARAAAEDAARTAGLRPSFAVAAASQPNSSGDSPPISMSSVSHADGPGDPSAAARAQYVAQVTGGGADATPAPFVRRSPATPFLLRAGTHLTLNIDGPINSDNPVLQTAHLLEPLGIRDSIWKRFLLLPPDTEVLLRLDTAGAGSRRVTVRIIRFNFPDGTYMDLTPQSGTGPDGEGGFGGSVNDHRGSIITAALLTAGLSAIPIIAAGPQSAASGPTAAQQVAGQVASQVTNAGTQVIQSQLARGPTIFVPASKIEGMVLDTDIAFPAPYTPQYPDGSTRGPS